MVRWEMLSLQATLIEQPVNREAQMQGRSLKQLEPPVQRPWGRRVLGEFEQQGGGVWLGWSQAREAGRRGHRGENV